MKRYTKSSFCNSGTCVEVAIDGPADSSATLVTVVDADGNEAYFHPDEWDAFVKGVKNGEFDLEKLEAEYNG